jgi:hydrogenase maturation protease
MKEYNKSVERSLAEQPDFVQPSTIVIGLGNPILGDDGVGWRVAERVKSSLCQEIESGIDSPACYPVEVDCLSLGGLSLMERIIGFEQAIIIDAITTKKEPLGRIYCFTLDKLPKQIPGHLSSAHDTDLQTAIEVGRSMGVKLPDQIMIIAVESQISYDFSESLSPEVEAAVPKAANVVLELLSNWAESAGNHQTIRHG